MVVGTGEYLKLLSETGRSGLITVNVTRPGDEAAAWVRYIRDTNPDVVPLWEVGNESYLNQDPSFMSAVEYVQRFKAFAAVMKNADPTIKWGPILEASLTE
jgi:alpha-L-arabinofuranosidase